MNHATSRIVRVIAAAVSAVIGLACAMAAHAADYPSKPITFVVPFGAGSATDLLARALAAPVAQQAGQAVVVENRAGASGMIAAQHAARAAADGYTVLITTNTTQAANPHLFKKLPYDPTADFMPLTALGRGGQVLVVRAEAPFRTVDDLLDAARRSPGRMSFGSGNSSSRMAGEMLKQLTDTDIVWVGYNSNPNALNDLLGGHIDMMVIDTVTGLAHIEAGRLRPLGASTKDRLPQLPRVPTLDEAGIRGYDMGYWFAAYVPAGTPAPVAAKLRQWLVAAVSSEGAQAFFRTSATQAWTTSPVELSEYQNAEIQKWGRVIEAAGIAPE